MKKTREKSCGACKACCVELKIATPEFRKKAHAPCRHLTATGCGIYAGRYPVCREFLCGWRLSPELGEAWRPDRSGVLILSKAQTEVPPRYRPAGPGVQLMITGGEAAITRPGFVAYVAGLLGKGVAVYLSAGSPATLLNEHLGPARDQAGLERTLLQLHGLLHESRWRKGLLGMLPSLYRLQAARWRARTKKINNIR